jgi:hypothetical protein
MQRPATEEQLARHVQGVINRPAAKKRLANGRRAWLGHDGTIVVVGPKGSTAYNPDNRGEHQSSWEAYDDLRYKNDPLDPTDDDGSPDGVRP